MVDPAPLTAREEHAWRVLVRLMVVLPRAIDEDLATRSGGVSLTRYVVLMRLSEAQERSMRMSALADAASISPSRMTRIIQAMHADGLVERRTAPGDARASLATLTDAGLQLLQHTWPAHLAGVRALVMDHLAPDDLAGFIRITERLLSAIDAATVAAGVDTRACDGPGQAPPPASPGAVDACSHQAAWQLGQR